MELYLKFWYITPKMGGEAPYKLPCSSFVPNHRFFVCFVLFCFVYFFGKNVWVFHTFLFFFWIVVSQQTFFLLLPLLFFPLRCVL